jgi:hypothetical protein
LHAMSLAQCPVRETNQDDLASEEPDPAIFSQSLSPCQMSCMRKREVNRATTAVHIQIRHKHTTNQVPICSLSGLAGGSLVHHVRARFTAPRNLFAPKFGTWPIRLTPPVRPVFHNGLTGEVSCSRSGNGRTGLTGGPDRSVCRTPSSSRIVESLRISICKRIPCGARPSHPKNIKGHDRLRRHHPIDHYFLQLLSLKP